MKLGLIAISGVRVQDTELMRLGLTLPGFVERSRVIASLPSLALLTLAGLTPDTVEVAYLEVPDLASIDGLPGEFDAVPISSYTARIKDAYALAERYRSAGTAVVLGGLHVTALPQEARAHADTIVLGEAEPVWPRLIADLQGGRLRPVYDARGESFDLARAPIPRFELLDVSRYNRLTVQTQRGCPLSCEFCASSIRLVPRFKVKPVERVIAEIRRIKEIWADPFIEFADDNTFANRAHGRRLLRALAREKVRWFTETNISTADDIELLDLMRDAGCGQVLIGLEAPGGPALRGLEMKSDWKGQARRDLSRGYPQDSEPRHPRERLLHSRARRAGRRQLRGGGPVRARQRTLRRAGDVADAVSGYAAASPAAGGGASAARRRVGALHAVRRHLPAAGHVRRRAGGGIPLPRARHLQRRCRAGSPAPLHGRASGGAGRGSAARCTE